MGSVDDLDDDLRSGPTWGRHPADVVRLVLAGLALVLATGLALRHPADVRTVSVDVVDLVNALPRWVRDLLLGVTQILALLVPVAMVAVLARKPRLLVTAIASAAVAALAMAYLQSRVDAMVPNQVVAVTERPSWITGAAFPSGAYVAAFTAMVVVLGPVLSREWRRLAVVGLTLASLSRVVTAVAVPLNLAITVSLGAVVASAALALGGSPRRRASRRAVLAALARAGFPADRVEPLETGAGHAQTFLATTPTGRRGFVKFLGRDERDADLLLRIVKLLRVKAVDDERPSWTPERLVEHEALSALLAGRQGASVPDVLAAGVTDGGDGLLVLAPVVGEPLHRLPPEAVTDELLDRIWTEVVRLHDQGLAHRWLTAPHVVVDLARDAGGPTVTLVDFRWAVHQAEPPLLGADIAMLTTSLALIVGAERSVAAAARVLSPDQLADALPMTQPLAMPADLRRAIGDQKHVLPAVRDRLQEEAGDVPYQLADIQRIGLRQALSLAGGVFLVYVLLGFISSWPEIRASLTTVALADLPLIFVLAAVPHLSGAGTFMSVSPGSLPYAEVVRLMLAQSFLNRFTPANAGGMALRIRYLQQRGVELGAAAAGVALTSAASGVNQVVVILSFAVWAGSSADGGSFFSLPKASTLALGVAALAVLGGLVWFTPWGRRVVADRVVTTVRQVWDTLVSVAREPRRFSLLFGTTLLSKLATIVAFSASCRALDISLAFPRLGLLYLTASTVASAAPTPGGVGAIEAALAAALTGAGVPPADAVSAVFLFRLFTYWLPVPFGWWSLRSLRRTVLPDA